MTTNALCLFPVVSSIFSSFVFIFGPIACLCGCLHLYLVILRIILVFLHLFLAILSLFVLFFFLAIWHLTMVGLRLFHVASLCGLLHLCGHFASLSSPFLLVLHPTMVGLCLFLVMLHLSVVILCV